MKKKTQPPVEKIGRTIYGRDGGSGTDESPLVEYDGAEDV